MSCMKCLTNYCASLIKRAVEEEKSLVFTKVCITQNVEKTSRSELIGKRDIWYGAKGGDVVACISHVTLDDTSCVCNSKLGIKLTDNVKPWKTISVWGKVEGDSLDGLLYAESDDNGSYNNAVVLELPVSLADVVEDFGGISGDMSEYATLSDLQNYYTKAEIDGSLISSVSYDSTNNALHLESPDGTKVIDISLS